MVVTVSGFRVPLEDVEATGAPSAIMPLVIVPLPFIAPFAEACLDRSLLVLVAVPANELCEFIVLNDVEAGAPIEV